jgi:hypothetical protein
LLDPSIEYWAAATAREKGVAAVEKELPPGSIPGIELSAAQPLIIQHPCLVSGRKSERR